mmetsp:Transcript_15228/g.31389  ORF Transcript_15228/g.31389 Transcript_15228/m.31389 type:complete len:257 (-) Transcript_15228:418-1188(-)
MKPVQAHPHVIPNRHTRCLRVNGGHPCRQNFVRFASWHAIERPGHNYRKLKVRIELFNLVSEIRSLQQPHGLQIRLLLHRHAAHTNSSGIVTLFPRLKTNHYRNVVGNCPGSQISVLQIVCHCVIQFKRLAAEHLKTIALVRDDNSILTRSQVLRPFFEDRVIARLRKLRSPPLSEIIDRLKTNDVRIEAENFAKQRLPPLHPIGYRVFNVGEVLGVLLRERVITTNRYCPRVCYLLSHLNVFLVLFSPKKRLGDD